MARRTTSAAKSPNARSAAAQEATPVATAAMPSSASARPAQSSASPSGIISDHGSQCQTTPTSHTCRQSSGTAAPPPDSPDFCPSYRFGDGSRRPETSRLLGLAQNRFRDAEAIDPDRNTAIDRDLGEHRADLVGAEAVAQRAADVGLELLHLSERGDHSEVEDRALARGQRLVAPGFAPAILGDDALKIAVEVVGALERAVDVLLAEHFSAHGEAAVVGVLVHVVIPPASVRARGAPR